MKKFLCIMLSLVLMLSIFASCKKGTPQPSEDVTQKEGEGTQKESDNDKKSKTEDDKLNLTGLPIVKDKITLKMMSRRSASQGDWSKMEVMQYLEEKTNIHFDINDVPEDQYAEKKQLAFATGDLPDVFMRAALSKQDEETYGSSEGLLMPLNELIEEYSPNLNKLLAERPDVRRAMTALDGNIYTLPYVYSTNTMADVRWINTKWLEHVGLEMPETIDDFYTVLKAFKEQDPNQNGKADEIPMSMDSYNRVRNYLLPAFGIVGGGRWNINLEGDKVIYAPLEDEYKEYILYVRKLYSEGLLDQEIFEMTSDKITAKGKAGVVGIFHDNLVGMVPEEQDRANYYVLPPLTSHVNSEKMTQRNPGTTTGTFAITHINKYPEATMRWVDLFYADHEDAIEGISGLSVDKGWEGVHWEYVDKEKTMERSLPKPDNWNKHKDFTPFGAGGMPRYVNWWVIKEPVEGEVNATAIKIKGAEENYYPYMKHSGFPGHIRYTKEEDDKRAEIEDNFGGYVSQMETKFITGEEPMEKWDEFIKTIKQMGVEEAMQIRQTALDRWLSIE